MDYKSHYSHIDNDFYRINIMRQYYVESIQDILTEDEIIDICSGDNEDFPNNDPAYVTFHDRLHDCNTQEQVVTFAFDGASTDNGFVCYEDMTITEVMQCYRCIVEFKEWKETGKITYM